MPRVAVRMTNADEWSVRDMDLESVANLIGDFQSGEAPVLTMLLGELGNNDIVHLHRHQISSIQVEG